MSSLTAFSLAEKDNLRDVEITKVNKWAPKCPNCGTKMTFALYEKGICSINGGKITNLKHQITNKFKYLNSKQTWQKVCFGD